MTQLLRGIAVPNFAEDPAELIELGVAAERAGFDGFFLWDHIVFSNTGEGPPIVDPWLVLAVVAVESPPSPLPPQPLRITATAPIASKAKTPRIVRRR